MTQKIKDYLGIALIVVALIAAYSALSYVSSYSRSVGLSVRSFAVQGSGKVSAVPDIAQFTFGVTTEGGKNLSALQDENAQKINQAITYLKDNGVDEKDIKTRSLNITPRYSNYNCYVPIPGPVPLTVTSDSAAGSSGSVTYPEVTRVCPPQEIIGYTINQSVTVKVREMDKVGDIYAGVVDNGANSAYGLSFTIDDTTSLENQARADAIKEAESKAKAIADAGGFRLGRLLSVDELGNYYPTYYGLGAAESVKTTDSSTAPSVEPGEQDITVNVSLRYEIK